MTAFAVPWRRSLPRLDPASPPPRRPGFFGTALRLLWRPLLVLAVAGALGAWILGWQFERARVQPAAAPPEPPAAETPARWTPREKATPAPGCAPRAKRRCIQGDAWWIDGCDNPYEKAEDCDHRRCDEGTCEPPDPPDCGGIPVLGRCIEDVAETCDAGRPFRRDCGRDEDRCVMTEEGPACRPRTEDDCEWPRGTTRCEGDVLVACVEGRLDRIDCRIHGGTCEARPGGAGDRCVVRGPARGRSDCGACGCEPERGEEICDGRDNDLDGWVDEDGGCEPVDVLAFVVEDERGGSSWSDTDIEEELDVLNAAFARDDDLGIELRLVDVVALRRPEWVEVDQTEVDEIVRSGLLYPERERFFVPIVFTGDIVVEEVPRPGLATVPNGVCGGIRRARGPQSPVGLVAMAKRHWPTTLAHEVGHFLGLCHTHTEPADAVLRIDPAAEGEDGETVACDRPCDLDADGLCDTPPDPGPSVCRVDELCAIACDDGEQPDPANVMAYYPTCRNLFSREQAELMRTTVWLRSQWHRCLWGEGCSCDPRTHGCPEGMSCRSLAAGDGDGGMQWACGLEGASVPGGPCKSSLDCSQDSVCVIPGDSEEGRCVRPCDEQTLDCQCREVEAFALPLCIDDAIEIAP